MKDCKCRMCWSKNHKGKPVWECTAIFIVCPVCGNKRCPKANHHINECTGSNEPGQKGSAYENR